MPNPTAEPIAAITNAALPFHRSRLLFIFHILITPIKIIKILIVKNNCHLRCKDLIKSFIGRNIDIAIKQTIKPKITKINGSIIAKVSDTVNSTSRE